MRHVEVTDITGTTWVGDSFADQLTAEQLSDLHEVLKNFTTLEYLSLEVGGAEHFFNPAHIVVASIHTDQEVT